MLSGAGVISLPFPGTSCCPEGAAPPPEMWSQSRGRIRGPVASLSPAVLHTMGPSGCLLKDCQGQKYSVICSRAQFFGSMILLIGLFVYFGILALRSWPLVLDSERCAVMHSG